MRKARNAAGAVVLAMAAVALCFLDLGPAHAPDLGTKERARVVATDDSAVERLGLLQTGPQKLEVEILSGAHKGERFTAYNQLRAQLELDKVFAPGDVALVAMVKDAKAGVTPLVAQDHYRIGWTVVLFGLFAVLLAAFGGVTGVMALFSFVFSCLAVWKLVIPLCLRGWNPMGVSFGAVTVLTAVIMFLVAGFTRKGVAAFLGAILGVAASCAMAWIFTGLFRINGAVMPYSQALLYSGYSDLSLSEIFIGAVFLSSSGAVMDLAMDVASGMEEIAARRPDLSARELCASGMRIGRSVVGTMTTTLLLAYSGGYLTLMMAFLAQGTGPLDFINNPYVASEVVKTLVGSFGLVLVAPFTALAGARIFVCGGAGRKCTQATISLPNSPHK